MSLFKKTLAVVLVAAVLLSCTNAELIELTPDDFHKTVNDASKDVFVMFYAPWCIHCNHMKPAWKDLAEKYSTDANTVIARIDASKHREIAKEFSVTGFPTLKFFSKKDKSGARQFSGERTLATLDDFVKTHKA